VDGVLERARGRVRQEVGACDLVQVIDVSVPEREEREERDKA